MFGGFCLLQLVKNSTSFWQTSTPSGYSTGVALRYCIQITCHAEKGEYTIFYYISISPCRNTLKRKHFISNIWR